MKHLHVIGSLFAVVFGVSLVAISLISASQVQSQGLEVAEKKMYFEDEMLPDHALYPVKMARDRVVLELSRPDDRIVLRIEYAASRMRAALLLLERGQYALALSTATKAQKYLLTAVLEAHATDIRAEQMSLVKEALHAQTTQLEELQSHFSGEDHAVIEQLLLESYAVLQ